MRRADRTTFDFSSGVWVREDPTTPTGSYESSLVLPTSEPAPGRWTKPAPALRSNERLVALIVWASVVFVVATIVVKSLAPLALGAVPLTLLCAALMARRSRDVSITEADRRLLEDPDDRDVCLVHLTIVHNGSEVGRDKGAAWFGHGALMYSGHRTSFVIGGEDVLPRAKWSVYARADGTDGLPETALPLRIPKGHAYIRLDPLLDRRGGGTPHEMRFLKALYDFRRRPPTARVPRQWPPLER